MTETIYLLALQMVRERHSLVKFYTSLHLSHIMLFFPRAGFSSHPADICCCIFCSNPCPLYFGHEPNISSSNSAVTRTRTDDTPPELCYVAFVACPVQMFLKCFKTPQRSPLFLLKLGKYLRLRRFATCLDRTHLGSDKP